MSKRSFRVCRPRLFGIVALAALVTVVAALCARVESRTSDNPKIALLRKGTAPTLATAGGPVIKYTAHTRGNMQLVVGNNGTFGYYGDAIIDPLTGMMVESCAFPKNSDLVYLWISGIWIGGVVGRDTLVSVGEEDFYTTRELLPDIEPFGDFVYESIDQTKPYYSPDAYSEEDIICEYTDTIVDGQIVAQDPYDNRSHKPLGVKVTQRSMAWSYSYAEDFILFDYQAQNIGPEILHDVYLGIWVDGDVWHVSNKGAGEPGWDDDAVGFYFSHPTNCATCVYEDSIRVAYHVDNDGDPAGGVWDNKSVPHAVGVRVVRTPAESLSYSFNWWAIEYGAESNDWGPRRAGTPSDPFRSFGQRLGTPEGDRNKYYILRHEEFDYDLLYTAVDHSLQGWLPPPKYAEEMAGGGDTRYLLSFGPFDIHPGQKLPISFAWVGGEYYHSSPSNYARLFDPYDPDPLYRTFDFSDLALNSRWASWVYDNPGVDTDGDGYAGKRIFCVLDSTVTEKDTTINGHDTLIYETTYTAVETCWVEGDGVPDFVGAGPPPAPDFWIEPDVGKLRIRFNGLSSETSRDVFSNLRDFEGYRIYMGRDDRAESFSMIASYDIEDYNQLVLVDREYKLISVPFTRAELQAAYGDPIGDPNFQPLRYTRQSPYVHPDFPDSVFVFEAQDYNVSRLGIDTDIRKIYPDQPYPSSLDPDSVEASELTDDGYFKYFEYELTITDLLASVPYWVNVTAFDFGSPVAGLPSLETSYLNDYQVAYPIASTGEVERRDLDVYVYPNPYRIDGDYADAGYENRKDDKVTEKARLLHFANLPSRCKISIFSLDGDLVQEIEHNALAGDPAGSHESWNLLTRNRQILVSGLYYYVVESSRGTQIGKFAVIK